MQNNVNKKPLKKISHKPTKKDGANKDGASSAKKKKYFGMNNTDTATDRARTRLIKKACKTARGNNTRIKRYALIALLITLLILFVCNAQRYAPYVTKGLELFCRAVLPCMLPFFFLSGLLNLMQVGRGIRLKRLSSFYRIPPTGVFAIILGFLCGYPVGAKLTQELYLSGAITQKEAKDLLPLTSTSGPAFILGSVGAMLLKDSVAAMIIFASHYGATMLNALLFRSKKQTDIKKSSPPSPTNYNNLLFEAMNGAVSALPAVAGYIALFCVLTAMLDDLRILPLTSRFITILLAPFTGDAQTARSVAIGLIEMTGGIAALCVTGESRILTTALSAALITFGGGCVALQSISYLSAAKIKLGYYLLTKLCSSVIAFCLAYCISAALL